MRRRLGLATLATLTLALTAASPATAATEAGSSCTGNGTQPELTVFQLANSSADPLPAAAPVAGVVTQWKVTVADMGEGSLAQKLLVLRPTGALDSYEAVAETSSVGVTGGANVVPARIPALAGDRFGLFGPEATLICETGDPADLVNYTEGSPPIGSSRTFNLEDEAGTPVSVVIEADADGDGFGDETQDKCPQSAAAQSACPAILLSSFGLAAKGSVLALVTANTQAPVSVSGTVVVPDKPKKGKGKGKGHAKSSAVIALDGGTQAVGPGQLAQFTLAFPGPLKAALATLPRGRSLTLQVTSSATNVVGVRSVSTVEVKLPGQKPKPKPKGKAKAKGQPGS